MPAVVAWIGSVIRCASQRASPRAASPSKAAAVHTVCRKSGCSTRSTITSASKPTEESKSTAWVVNSRQNMRECHIPGRQGDQEKGRQGDRQQLFPSLCLLVYSTLLGWQSTRACRSESGCRYSAA